MTNQTMDQTSAVEPPIATAVTLAHEQAAVQKQDLKNTESPFDNTPNIESLDIIEDSNSGSKVRSKLRSFTTVLMLCVRSSPFDPQRAPID
jgi:hypothetical protein